MISFREKIILKKYNVFSIAHRMKIVLKTRMPKEYPGNGLQRRSV